MLICLKILIVLTKTSLNITIEIMASYLLKFMDNSVEAF